MASYFDIAPRTSSSKTADAAEDEGKGSNTAYDEADGRFGLMSPQVSRILDDLELDDQSSGSEDTEEDESDQEKKDPGDASVVARQANEQGKSRSNFTAINKPTTSTPSSSSKLCNALTPNENPSSDKTPPTTTKKSRPASKGAKQPHFTRFQSLRTMLFSSHIEENFEKSKREEAEQKWKKDFQSRKGLERQKTSEKVSGPSTPGIKGEERDGGKERGVMKRMGSRLKRLGSKDVQTMGTLTEGEAVQDKHVQPNKTADVRHDTGNESTASSDEEKAGSRRDSEEINHSDVEDLVRWISRRDPPSDGEARHRKSDPQNYATNSEYINKLDSDQESLGQSDVEDLVRWVSRREATNKRPDAEIQRRAKGEEESVIGTFYDREGHASYSDADTQSDSEADQTKGRKATMNDDDVDELVRWISRREGLSAGPVRSDSPKSPSKSVKPFDSGTGVSSTGSEPGDEDVAELLHWIKRSDDTSGESLDESLQPKGGDKNTGSKLRDEVLQKIDDGNKKTGTRERSESGASLSPEDVDELVRWVSRKHSEV